MRAAVVLIVVVGCTSTEGPICGPKRCAGNQVCDLTDVAGPTCIPADGDLDGDGIPNSEDLCDHIPGGKYDEDGDGLGDECDPCPIAPPPATPDPDGDAVDRPCDPDPNTPGDKIVAFSGFHELPADWTGSSPDAFRLDNGDLVVTPPDGSTQIRLAIPISLSSYHVAFLTQWRVDGLIASAALDDVALAAIDRRPAGVAHVHCGAQHDAAGDHLQLDTDTSTARQDLTSLFDTTSLYRAAVVVDTSTASCALIADASQGALQDTITADPLSEADLVATGTIVRFAYALVIARDPAISP